MAIKIGDLKLKEVRKEIQVPLEDGNFDKITVFNPLGEKRRHLLNKMKEYSSKDTKNAPEKLTRIMFKELTDLEITKKDDILDIIENPSGELLIVLETINEIKTELEYEFWVSQLMQINQVTIGLLTTKTIEKTKHIQEIVRELEDGEVPIEDLEEIFKKALSKGDDSDNGEEI